MFNQSWRDQDREEPEEVSPARCFFGAAGVLLVVLIGIVFVYVGLIL